MLIKFSVKNFLSIDNEQELALYPSKVRAFPDRVFQTKQHSLPQLLKSAIVYGANASGKSSLVKAVDFSRQVIILSTPWQWNNMGFKLSANPSDESIFSYDLLLNEEIYSYTFTTKSGIIAEEKLERVTSTTTKSIFHRTTSDGRVIIDFAHTFISRDSEQFHKTICQGTRANQLFLNFINQQNMNAVEPVFKEIFFWFRDKLTVIFPNTKVQGIEFRLLEDKALWEFYNSCLKSLDTGISHLSFEEFGFDDAKFQLPPAIKEDIRRKMQTDNTVMSISSSENDIYYVQRKTGQLSVKKIKAAHKIDGYEPVLFDFRSESDGTNRIMELIPMLYLLKQGNTVLIDEIDRSFHALVSEAFFQLFYEATANQGAQLIATTHNLLLLSLEKFRRDEIWFIEKDNSGRSKLYSLEEFKPRFDKHLRKAYLDGRFGALPYLPTMSRAAHAI